MAQILVRDLDDRLIKQLKARARRKGHSLQAEAKAILEDAAQMETRLQTGWKRLEAIRRRFQGRRFDDSAVLIRKDRDRR